MPLLPEPLVSNHIVGCIMPVLPPRTSTVQRTGKSHSHKTRFTELNTKNQYTKPDPQPLTTRFCRPFQLECLLLHFVNVHGTMTCDSGDCNPGNVKCAERLQFGNRATKTFLLLLSIWNGLRRFPLAFKNAHCQTAPEGDKVAYA
jgi:hypothetical protein